MALIDDLVHELRAVVAAHPDHIAAFTAEHRSFEGWFCAEFTKVLLDLRVAKRVSGFVAGRNVAGKVIDFTVERSPEHIAIEFKAWPMSVGREWPASYMVQDSTGFTGIGEDADKLSAWQGTGAYLVAICYVRPSTKLWRSGLRTYKKNFPNHPARSRTRPGSFPPTFFIGVLQLK